MGCIPEGRGHGAWCKARSNSSSAPGTLAARGGALADDAARSLRARHDGRSLFAAIYSPGFSGVAEIDARRMRSSRSRRFRTRPEDQAGGPDGRRLVWAEYHSLTSLGDFTVGLGPCSKKSDKIGLPRNHPAAILGQSFADARRAGRIATSVQGIGPGGVAAVHVYNLRTGRADHPPRSRAGLLPLRGAPRRLARVARPRPRDEDACRLGAHRQARRCATALRALDGVRVSPPTRHRIAYPDAPYRSIWWSPSPRRRPRRSSPHARATTSTTRCRSAPVRRLRDLAASVRRRHADASLRRSGWPRRLDSGRRHHAAGGLRLLDKGGQPRLRLALVPLGKLPPIPACTRRGASQAP